MRLFKLLIASSAVLALTIAIATSEAVAQNARAVLWREPADIASRDLYYGPGGKAHEPHGTFAFDKEDMNGTSPKFDVIDQDGVRWRVKMGDEAGPETAASRFVWAAGYFANEDYFLPEMHIQNMPHLRRGGNMVSPDGTVRNVRLKRHNKDEKKIGTWAWAKNPFTGTREWYGLQVLMAVINNWDLKDINNAIYEVAGRQPEQRYSISDLGASFGSVGLNWLKKGNPKAYSHSKWIKGHSSSAGCVDFNVPSHPAVGTFISLPELVRRSGLTWIGRRVPIEYARWMGNLLGQLSEQQIRDAFRAAGYGPEDVETFSREVERRIAVLQTL
jgi:hypothetical protein